MKPILYYWPGSPMARSVMMVIRNLDLDVEIQEKEPLVHLKPEYAQVNPNRKIPVLEDNGFYLPESIAICRYLIATKAPKKADEFLGADEKERAIINNRLYFNMGTLFQKISQTVKPILRQTADTVPILHKEEIYQALEVLDVLLDEFPYAAGDHVTLADLMILATVAQIKSLGASFSKYPAINRWYGKCRTLPGFEENEALANAFGKYFSSLLKEPF